MSCASAIARAGSRPAPVLAGGRPSRPGDHGRAYYRMLESSRASNKAILCALLALARAGSNKMELLEAGARDWGMALAPEQVETFELYYRELVAWNQKVNLTAITDYEEVQVKHFLDSLSCLQVLADFPAEMSCIDIGTGAGFPGLPLKIVRPEMRLTLLEATGKKADFLQHMVVLLGLANVQVLKARAEELGRRPEYREAFRVAVARAVGDLAVLVEYALPLLELEGVFVAQKGREVDKEVEAAKPAVKILGGRVQEVRAVRLPGADDERHLVVVQKVTPTPPQYPRRPGIPAKRPLTGDRAR